MEILIVGGGIGGLALALNLHARGVACTVFEAAAELRPVGVGVSVLPHMAQELAALGLGAALERVAVRMRESVFFNRFGQLIYRDPADPALPQYLIHRGDLHMMLVEAVRERLGPERLHLAHTCVGAGQDRAKAFAHFHHSVTGEMLETHAADAVVGCDGVRSAVRRMLFPSEGPMQFEGIVMWRGVTRHAPFLSGGSHVRAGVPDTGKMVIYPMRDDVDGQGRQLVNWVCQLMAPGTDPGDWNRKGELKDFYPAFESWRFDWLDCAALIRDADFVLEYPMCDRDPLPRWSHGRITLLGDAAHPMYPRGSNGAAQAIIDARVLAEAVVRAGGDAPAALAAYEDARREVTGRIVLKNRSTPPDYIIERVRELTGDRPFEALDQVVSQQELQALLEDYKAAAGYSARQLLAAGA